MSKKIYIDPGHSDKDPGAVGYEVERDLNEKVAKYMRAYLRDKYVCEVKVDPVTNNSLTGVGDAANNWGADLYVSIHFNAGGGDGFEVWVYSEERKALGKIFERHVKAIGQNSRGVKIQPGFVVLKRAKMPAVLNECAFVDNKKDIEDWNEDAELKKMGIAFAKAAAEYLGLEKKVVTPAPEPEPEKKYIYRVQVGAYSNLPGAEKELEKLRAAGFGGIIVKAEK
jgi:N-acetylmuramoyl-L-alanine amidase